MDIQEDTGIELDVFSSDSNSKDDHPMCNEEFDLHVVGPSRLQLLKNYISRKRKILFLILMATLVVVIVAGIAASTVTYFTTDPPRHYDLVQNFGVVIDLGSGGSRVTVFQWDEEHRIQNSPYGGFF